MIAVEYQIELGLRTAIRAALSAAAATVEQLGKAKIIGYRLPPENEGDNGATGLHVFLKCAPNGSGGYNPSTGFEAQRTASIEVGCVTPFTDMGAADVAVHQALYMAVRGVFEAAPFAADLGTGIAFGGMLITNGGSAELEDVGQVDSFNVEMHISVTA